MLRATGSGDSNSGEDIPVHMISFRDNMYQKVTRMLQFLFHYCEEQEHDNQETSVVCINIAEKADQKEGEIIIDVDGSWLKHFNIRLFLVEILKHEKLNFTIHYGNPQTQAYYLYNITYNEDLRRTETQLHLQESSLIDKGFYLRITVFTTIHLVKSMFNKIRNYLKVAAPKHPSVEIQFNASGYSLTEEDLDDKYFKMIAETVGDVIKYGTNFDFRRAVFEMFNVTSKEWAVDELYNQLCHCLPEN